MSDTVQLDPPRWRGGPPICPIENLPALKTLVALNDFIKANGPEVRITRIWSCVACGHWHAETKPRPPSGFSSGTNKR